ncbi:uncharacterized protein [Aquarana catesbeiana]|uniref:uncharacterized protein isoform X1 n=1 Tax=Aquarana catesbeiana TaxID=8400 RepID=UPI003CCA692C
MSFSDYNCSLIVEPVSLLFLFCSSIAHKHRQSGHTGKQVSLLPHEKELLAAVGEDEIRKLLAHQDHLQAQRRRRQRAEEQSSTSSTCSVIQSEGETEEEAEAATPRLSEVFILQLHPVDEGLDLPASGWTDCPSESPVVSTVLHPSTSPHLDDCCCCLLPSASFTRSRTGTHPPPSRATCDGLSAAHCGGPRETICSNPETVSIFGPPQSWAAPSLCGSG